MNREMDMIFEMTAGPLVRYCRTWSVPRLDLARAAQRGGRATTISLVAATALLLGMRGSIEEGSVSVEVADAAVPAAVVAPLPLDINDRVEYWVNRFSGDQWPVFKMLLERKGAYEGLIGDKLRERGLPEQLVYLALIEGGFLPWAVSSASAVGLWQFMGPTAMEFGLRVDGWVDERRDPVRATDAALDYLTFLYNRYGSWYLAAAAYNAGPGRVDRVLNRYADGRRGDDSLYWEVLEHLPLETRHYVARLVAATLVGEEARGALDIASAAPYSYEIVFVPGGTPLRRVADEIGVEVDLLASLNPHLIRGVTPPGEAGALRVPRGTSPTVVASMARSTSRTS
jgi:membrane-bound lytic murein transglycosylase D